MAYIDELLGRDEQILYDGRQHAFVLISNILTEMVLIAVLIAAGVAARAAFPSPIVLGLPVGQVVLIACGLISLVVLISAFLDYLRWNNEQYIVTDQRVIQLRGIFNKAVIDSSLDKINDVELRQSWLGRMFDFGTIEILTASDVGINQMRWIAHPLQFKRAMLEAKHNFNRGYGYLDPQAVAAYTQPAAYPGGQGDLEHTLQQLADLRDQGLLSQDEFEAKKRELLSRI
ncbi:MAG: PH domain-containing protein [Kouleothrix sp.]|nr:PH domain-containing protein [Kouleothrix sp.]